MNYEIKLNSDFDCYKIKYRGAILKLHIYFLYTINLLLN